MTTDVSIEAQIAAVRRELALRRKLYPGWIESRRLKQQDADAEIAAMVAILKTLEGVKSKEAGDLFESDARAYGWDRKPE